MPRNRVLFLAYFHLSTAHDDATRINVSPFLAHSILPLRTKPSTANGLISDVCALLAGKVAAYERLRGMYLEEIQILTVRITEKAQLLAEQPDLVQLPSSPSLRVLMLL